MKSFAFAFIALFTSECIVYGQIPKESHSAIDPALTIPMVTVQDHHSEMITLPRKDYSNVIEENRAQIDCPHRDPSAFNWTDPAAWSDGKVPRANGFDVDTLLPNVKVIIRAGMLPRNAIYGIITIPSTSSVIFADEWINLRTKGINVQGSLLLGSPTCRLQTATSITLTGKAPASMVEEYPAIKGIFVMGTLDVHGMVYAPTWTRLAATASVGSTFIYVQDLVNWRGRQSIVIMTTALKDSLDYSESEQRMIVNIWRAPHLGPKITVIELDSPLKYNHYGGAEYQAEVALLSRNIVIRSNPIDSDPPAGTLKTVCSDVTNGAYPCYSGDELNRNGYGGHIMITGQGQGRLTGVQLNKLGQTNRLGRYPFHVHRVGDRGALSYLKESSITGSYFRAVSIHRSNKVVLSGNVAFDIVGHAFYLEDGTEEQNIIEFNLGAYVHWFGTYHINDAHDGQALSTVYANNNLLNPADSTASPFYTANRYNSFIGNTAIGGWTGYAVICQQNAIGKLPGDVNPSSRPILAFDGNTAHSTGFYWSHGAGVYMGGHLSVSNTGGINSYNPGRNLVFGSCELSSLTTSTITNTKTFLVGAGVHSWDEVDVKGLEVSDFANDGLQVMGSGVYFSNILMIGRTENKLTTFAGCVNANWWACPYRNWFFFQQRYIGLRWYDTLQMHYLQGATMRNFNDGKGRPFFFTSHSDEWVPGVMTFSTKIKYENCDAVKWAFTYPPVGADMSVSARIANWIDLDGSASGRGKPTMMGAKGDTTWWRTRADECDLSPDGYMWMCDMKPGVSWASMAVVADMGAYKSIGGSQCVNDGAVPKASNRRCPIIGYATPISTADPTQKVAIALNSVINGPVDSRLGGGWNINFNAGAPVKLHIKSIQLPDLQSSMILTMKYPASTSGVKVIGNLMWCLGSCWGEFIKPYDELTSLSALKTYKAGNGYFFDKVTRTLYVQVAPFDEDPSDGPNAPWVISRPHKKQFVKGGLTMLPFSENYVITVTATCWSAPGSLYCG